MSPTQFEARLEGNRKLRGGYYVLTLRTEPAEAPTTTAAPLAAVTPGQFVMLRGQWGRDLLSPRAFSVMEAGSDGTFSVMIKAYGRGTGEMARMQPGDKMVVTGPLGQGFSVPQAQGAKQLLVAGGVGLPPLHLQARTASAAGLADRVEVFYGGRDRDDLVLLEDFAQWGVAMTLATEDGSVGEQGFVTVPLGARLTQAAQRDEAVEILACGPTPMLKAVRSLGLAAGVPTWLCLEERMACGFGVCLGCAVPVYGPKPYRYCCTDGPVFDAREVRWS